MRNLRRALTRLHHSGLADALGLVGAFALLVALMLLPIWAVGAGR